MGVCCLYTWLDARSVCVAAVEQRHLQVNKMSLIQPPPDFPPEGFTLYDDILEAEEVFDDGTSGDLSEEIYDEYQTLDRWLRFDGYAKIVWIGDEDDDYS